MARILIVEDEESFARILAHALRTAGHTPLPAPTGHAALLAARAHPDLILLDLGLPDIPGAEVLRRLKQEPTTAQIPVVVVSGDPDAADHVPHNGANGAVAILQKPMLGSELCAVVDVVLEGRQPGLWDARAAARTGNARLDHHQKELVYRLISTGSYPLVRQVCRCLAADDAQGAWRRAAENVTWAEIVRLAKREGLLEEVEGQILLRGIPCRPVEQTV
jgi:DNA-binding response OmpR family regulator